MKRTCLLMTSLCLLALPACGDQETSSTTGTTPSAGGGGAGGDAGSGGAGAGGAGGEGGGAPVLPKVDLAWEPCPLLSDGTGPMAECARPDVPLRATDPTGKTIPYFVKRYSKPGTTPVTQLWMLTGGPGASGIIYEKQAELLAEQKEGLEIYIPDHRGTGDSSRLGCPVQEADGSAQGVTISNGEWPKCVQAVQEQWGEDLDAFNVTNAAFDLGVLVESARREEARVFVYGGSYGTFWGNRYLQLFPAQADGVILDAIAPPAATLARQDIDADEAAAELFQSCADDAACGPKLGGDPRAFGVALYDKLDTGHCPQIQTLGPGRILLRRVFGQMMMSWNARRLIPATLARADRCNAEDIAAIGTLFQYYFLTPSPVTDLLLREWSWVLTTHITFSEIWGTPEITPEQMAEWRDAAVVSRDVTERFTAPLKVMPRYPQDQYYQGFSTTERPLLMLQGTWDPATRIGPAEALKQAYTAPNHHWVEIPRGAHGALFSVPTVDGASCGNSIFLSFLDDPESPPDTSCLSNVAPFTFDGTPQLNQLLFGTEDAWGGL